MLPTEPLSRASSPISDLVARDIVAGDIVGDAETGGEPAGDAVLVLDAAGRVTYANAAGALLLGADSAYGVLGTDAVRAFDRGTAALALRSAIGTAHARAPHEAAFIVHDDRGAPVTHWRVA